jgi:transposase-like protein
LSWRHHHAWTTPRRTGVVERLEGSALAKVRAKVVLQTLARELTVAQACARLGICEQRFYQLREEHLRDFVAGFEPGKPGRPPRTLSRAEQQVIELQQQLAAKDIELRTAQAREEIAITLPRVVQVADAEKKTTHRPPRPKTPGRPPGKRTHP